MVFPDPQFSGLVELFGYCNSVTDDLFCPISLVALWLILFLWLLNRQYDPSECATAAGFITVWPAVFFRVMIYNGEPLISDTYLFFVVLSLIIPALWMYYLSKR